MPHVANPGIYKLVADTREFRVYLATWKPGQRDALHSHDSKVTYAVTACDFRTYGRDNSELERGPYKPGDVAVSPGVVAHYFENVGKSDCQLLLVERK